MKYYHSEEDDYCDTLKRDLNNSMDIYEIIDDENNENNEKIIDSDDNKFSD